MTVETKLKPCPFCGSTDIYIEPDEVGSGGQWVPPVHVGCNIQTGCGFAQVFGDDTDEAVAMWNARPDLQSKLDRATDALEALVTSLAENDEDGLTEFADVMVEARAALAFIKDQQ